MEQGQFCFLNDQYYEDFPDDKLMKNKEETNQFLHDRPCFFAFPDSRAIYADLVKQLEIAEDGEGAGC